MVYFHFASCLNFNDELFAAFPAGWNRDCSFRWDERCLSQQRAEFSHRVLLNSISRQLYPPAWLHFQEVLLAFRDILPIFLARSLCLTCSALRGEALSAFGQVSVLFGQECDPQRQLLSQVTAGLPGSLDGTVVQVRNTFIHSINPGFFNIIPAPLKDSHLFSQPSFPPTELSMKSPLCPALHLHSLCLKAVC